MIVLTLIVLILELLRRKVIREKYAFVWLILAVLISFGALFPNLINEISKSLGFQYLSNFVLLFFGITNFLIAMQLSLSIGKAEIQIQTLAGEIALLNSKLEDRNNN